jgi:hypothetical protein
MPVKSPVLRWLVLLPDSLGLNVLEEGRAERTTHFPFLTSKLGGVDIELAVTVGTLDPKQFDHVNDLLSVYSQPGQIFGCQPSLGFHFL